jgi:hypothetical protein
MYIKSIPVFVQKREFSLSKNHLGVLGETPKTPTFLWLKLSQGVSQKNAKRSRTNS